MGKKDADRYLAVSNRYRDSGSNVVELRSGGIWQSGPIDANAPDILSKINVRLSYVLTVWRRGASRAVVSSSVHTTFDEAEANFDLAVTDPDTLAARVVVRGRTVMIYKVL